MLFSLLLKERTELVYADLIPRLMVELALLDIPHSKILLLLLMHLPEKVSRSGQSASFSLRPLGMKTSVEFLGYSSHLYGNRSVILCTCSLHFRKLSLLHEITQMKRTFTIQSLLIACLALRTTALYFYVSLAYAAQSKLTRAHNSCKFHPVEFRSKLTESQTIWRD